MPFVTKDLSKTIMKISKLRNNYLKNKTDANRILYKKQRNYCVSQLLCQLRREKVSDNKPLGKVIKHSLSDKSCVKEQISLAEKGEI